MGEYCDLHTHSHYSDGTFAPAQLIEQAAEQGLSTLALTDHNTVAGLPEFLAAARSTTVQPIAGVEISTGYLGKELHIVGLFLKPETFDAVTDFLDIINRRKEESNRNLVHRLSQAGYVLNYEEIRANHPEGNVNRAVIAAAMTEKGYVGSVQEAFQTLLKPEHGYFQPPERISVFDAISFLSDLGAVAVLAHPFLNLTEVQLREFLPRAKAHGLTAMETLYSAYTPETTTLARQMAAEYGLMESGGSDFHGDNKPDIQLGTGRGNLRIPLTFAQTLQPKEN